MRIILCYITLNTIFASLQNTQFRARRLVSIFSLEFPIGEELRVSRSINDLICLLTENGLDVVLNPRDLWPLAPRCRYVPLLDVQVAGRRLRPASRCRRRRRCYHRSLSFPVCKQSKRILTGPIGQASGKGERENVSKRSITNDLRRARIRDENYLSKKIEIIHPQNRVYRNIPRLRLLYHLTTGNYY